MAVNKTIANRRRELGLSDVDVAAACGLSAAEFYDLEAYEDELTMAVELATVRKLCAILALNLSSLLNAPEETAARAVGRHSLIASRMRELGISTSRLSELIGFEELCINDIQQKPDALDAMNIAFIRDVAQALRLPLGWLLQP